MTTATRSVVIRTGTAAIPTGTAPLAPWKLALIRLLLASLVGQPIAASAQVVAAGGAHAPGVGAAQNGVPVVQITAPSAAGVSHNQYSQLNVAPQGLVFNNSGAVVQTQLAGWIDGNSNLGGGSARIILNEVVSTNPSSLRGYMEVAGSRAELVIANPNGITCNGCGFINTSRGILVTGTPVFGGNGSLDAFRVVGGNIAIEGASLNDTATDQIDLIARAVQVNAEIWGKTLNVVAGANQVAYADLATQTITGSGSAPAVGIDVALLGGMYANKIRLVGTESGVGVVAAGNIAAQAGDLVIDNRGRVTLSGSTSASGNLTVTAGEGFGNSGTLYAGQNARIDTQGQAVNTGTLAAKGNLDIAADSVNSTGLLGAGIESDGSRGTSGNLTVTAAAALVANGRNLAGGNIAFTGGSLDLANSITAANGNAAFTATSGNIDHRNGLISIGGAATLTASGGAIDNTGGAIEAGHGLRLAAQSLANSGGTLLNLIDGVLSIDLTGRLANTQDGYIGSNGSIDVRAGELDNAGGTLYAQGNVLLRSAATLSNRGGLIQTGADLDIGAVGAIDNTAGRIEATGLHSVVVVDADSVDNTGGRIANSGDGRTTVRAAAGIVNSNAAGTAGMGTIGGNGDVEIEAANLGNTQGGRVLAGGDLLLKISSALDNTAGTLYAAGNLTLDEAAATVQNAQGSIAAAGDIAITVAGLANQGGTVAAGNDVALTLKQANALTGAGSIVAGRDATLDLEGDQTNAAGNSIKANRNLDIAAGGRFTNYGTLEAVGALDLAAAGIDNRSTGIVNANRTSLTAIDGDIVNAGRLEGDTLTTTSATLTNTGTLIGNSVTVNADTLTNTGATALIGATDTVNLFVRNTLVNDAGATILSLGDIKIGADGTLDANGYLANNMASFTNSSATVEAGRNLRISANQITNKRAALDVQWGAERTGDYVSGNPRYTRYYTTEYVAGSTPAGRLLSGESMWLKGSIANQYSAIAAGGSITYNAATLTQTARALMETESDRGVQDNWQYVQTGSHHCGWFGWSICADYGWVNYPVAYNATRQYQVGSVDASLTANASITGTATTLDNRTVSSTGSVGGSAATLGAPAAVPPTPATSAALPVLTLPSNGLYTTHTGPAAPYLIETNPRFANYGTFLSSDYMLAQLALDPQATHKRLGDGFYEQTLINQQIVSQTGRKRLPGQADTQAEFQALMDAGISAARTFDLSAGIALTGAQIAALTRDIVWLVEQEVAVPGGGKDRVLVPVVYLSAAHAELKPNGALIAAADIDLGVGTLTNSGTIKSDATTRIVGTDLVNRGGVIASDGDLSLSAANDLVNQSGRLAGNNVVLAAGRDLVNERLTDALQLGSTATTRLHAEATIGAASDLTIAVGRDLANLAAKVTAGGNATMTAGRNLDVGTLAATDTVSHAFGSFGRTEQLVSTVTAGNDLTLVAANDATFTSAQLSAGRNASLGAGGNLALAATKDVTQSRSDSGVQKRSAYDETVRGTSLDAGNDLLVTAGDGSTGRSDGKGTLTLEAAQLASQNGSLTVAADAAVTVKEASERHESMVETRTEKKGIFSRTRTVEGSSSQRSDVIGSTLSGERVIVQSGSDLTVRGSNVVGTNDVTLTAQQTLSLEAAANTQASSSFRQETKSGLFGNGGLSVTLGSRSQKATDDASGTAHTGSTVGSVQGDVTLVAGEAYRQMGSSVAAPIGNVSITAPKVEIDAVYDTAWSRQTFEAKQSGLTLSVTNPVVSAVQTAQQMSRAASQTKDPRMKALAAANVAMAGKNAVDAVKTGQALKDGNAADKVGGINLSLSLGSSKSSSTSTQTSRTAVGSNVEAGNDLAVRATNGDLNVVGSKLAAGNNALLAAAQNLNLQAAANTSTSQSTSSSSSASVGVGIGLGKQTGVSVQASVSRSKGDAAGNDTAWTDTQVAAGNTLQLQSGADTTLKGATAAGKQVVADVGRNLAIESLQDTSRYDSKQSSAGVSLSVPIGAGSASASVSAGKSTVKSDYASVTAQSGIQAGDGGFQVDVRGNTDLKGAVIASTDQAVVGGKNRLTTATLTNSDIHNRANADAQSSNFGLSSDVFGQGKYGVTKTVLGNVLGTTKESASSSGVTRSAVSAGAVTITDDAKQTAQTGKTAEQTVASLNRDTANAQVAAVKQDVEAMKQTVTANQTIKQETIKIVTALTDEAYRSRFQEAPKLFKVECPAGADCVKDPSKLTRQLASKDDIEKAQGDAILAVNGIFNDEQRAMELAYQNVAPDRATGDKPSIVYLMHIAPTKNDLSELLAVAYEKIVTSADYSLANFLGYTNAQEAYAGLIKSRGDQATTSLGQSRGTLVQESAFTILANQQDANGGVYTNPNLTVRGVGGAANAESFSAAAAKVVNDPTKNRNITFNYFSNDPVAVTAGGNAGVWTLNDLWQVYSTKNSMHSCYGTGAAGCTQVEIPVPNRPQGTPEGNAKLIRYVGGQQVNANGNPVQQTK